MDNTATQPQGARSPGRQLWDEFCEHWKVMDKGVELFSTREDRVVTREYGSRIVLERSAAMDALLTDVRRKIIDDFLRDNRPGRYDGVIYLMYRIEDASPVPLYIGKAETVGKNGKLSVNISQVALACRWGYSHFYHIGDLSAAVLPDYPLSGSGKYARWARALFRDVRLAQPELREPVYFWACAWEPRKPIWCLEDGIPLVLLEATLVGLAWTEFPDLLNVDLVPRALRQLRRELEDGGSRFAFSDLTCNGQDIVLDYRADRIASGAAPETGIQPLSTRRYTRRIGPRELTHRVNIF